MIQSRKNNVMDIAVNKNAKVLHSDRDFEEWYLEQFDLTMFTDIEIKDVMEEERPESYPCVPIVQEGGYDVMYLREELIQHWFKKLYTVKLLPL